MLTTLVGNTDTQVGPARQAATFVETWTYAWEIRLFKDDPAAAYPPSRTTLGASLIAT